MAARKHSAASIEIGRRIAQLRTRANVSARTLAHCADMDLTNFQRIERGEGNPTISTLVQIATALEVDVSELVREIGPEQLQNGRAPYGYSEHEPRRRHRRDDGIL
ncbi:helix-turn-helix domain-containing protein [Microbacterium sp. gxy059]|uniref:helix-turn-helix domain-containing protein n=1 Tax=Microbacterium sp. gxy059 TaxID=2957199 RepID=UPI003D97587D